MTQSGGAEYRVELRLPYAAAAAGQARREVRDRLRDVLPHADVEDATLLTDELVANAVRHAQPEADGAVGLRIEVLDERVRIVVTDGSPNFEWATRVSAELLGGFGLVFVDRIADRWGLSLDGKKAVWFEVDVPPSGR